MIKFRSETTESSVLFWSNFSVIHISKQRMPKKIKIPKFHPQFVFEYIKFLNVRLEKLAKDILLKQRFFFLQMHHWIRYSLKNTNFIDNFWNIWRYFPSLRHWILPIKEEILLLVKHFPEKLRLCQITSKSVIHASVHSRNIFCDSYPTICSVERLQKLSPNLSCLSCKRINFDRLSTSPQVRERRVHKWLAVVDYYSPNSSSRAADP